MMTSSVVAQQTSPPIIHGRGRGHRGSNRHGRSRGASSSRCRGRGALSSHSRGASSSHGHRSEAATSEYSALEPVDENWVKLEPNSYCYQYTKTPGPTLPFTDDTTALDIFSRYFTHEVWDLLVTETNRYAQANLSHTPSARAWTDVTTDEMKAFVGLLLLLGIIKLPRLEMYWQTKNEFIGTPGIADVMSRNRFEQIYRFLHLADSTYQIPAGEPGHDKLYKIRQFATLLTTNFQSNYTSHQTATIDEAMIPFKGRLSFKQYMKAKPTKWGIKVFVLSDATNGYVYRMQIYTGKNMESDISVGLCSRVVLDLMSGLEADGFHLFTDNYYTSPQLALTLYKRGINCCGTVRTNRKGFPRSLVKTRAEKQRGYYDYLSNGPLLAAVWYDHKFVHFMSTMHSATLSGSLPTIMRRNKDGSQEPVPCPPLLPDYQQYMRGVDRGDQMIGYYNIGRRSRKWWKRCFAHLIECSLLNAFILNTFAFPALYAERGRKKRDFLAFRLDVAKQLIGGFCSRRKSGGRPKSADYQDVSRLNIQLGHWPVKTDKKLECIVCSTKRTKLKLSRSEMRHESRIKCCHCNVHLCLEVNRDCFTKYHTHIQYWL